MELLIDSFFQPTKTLGSTQLLIKMSAMNLLGDQVRPARKADNFTAICEPIF
jgi:hypothetical protein